MKYTGRELRGIIALLTLLALIFALLVALRFCRPASPAPEVRIDNPPDTLAQAVDSAHIIEPVVPDKPAHKSTKAKAYKNDGDSTKTKAKRRKPTPPPAPKSSPMDRSVKKIVR